MFIGIGMAIGSGGNAPVVAPMNTVPPAISGTLAVGQTLTTTDGTWMGTAPITYAYQWKRDGINIGGATNSTYVLTASDPGTAITVTVTATNVAGSTAATSAAVTPSSILTGLLSYWKLDEASGTRVDSVTTSGNDLTDNNTVTQAVGKIANAAQFTAANTEYLSRVSNAGLQVGASSAEWWGWFYLDTATGPFPAWYHLVAKGGNEYRIQITDTNMRMQAYFGGTPITASRALPSITTWHFFDAYFDAPNQLIGIALDGGAFTTQATGSGTMDTTATQFNLGALNGGNPLNGRLDEVGFTKRLLTTAERTALYNSGNGVTYPFL